MRVPDFDPTRSADFDRVDPATVADASLSTCRLTIRSSIEATLAVAAPALACLEPGGVARLRIPAGGLDPAIDPVLLIEALPAGWRRAEIGSLAGAVEVWVSEGADHTAPLLPQALSVASRLADDLRATEAELDRLKKDAARASKQAIASLERAHDSTQYRIGAALIDVVRRPSQIFKLPQVFRELWQRRSRPTRVELPAAHDDPTLDLRVASVLDEFTHDCFAPEFELVPLDRPGWEKQIDDVDLLLVESAWRGNRGRWSYTLNHFVDQGDDIRGAVTAMQRRGVPTVFWNKEDPVAFDVFLPAARVFDNVLTTDHDMVEAYRRELGHDRVGSLAFAAQPRLHNPVGRARGAELDGRVCFAGSWRGDKYGKRGEDFDVLLRPPLQRGVLDIYDRYADGPDAETLGFPAPFREAVVGSLPYSEMVSAYRRYAAFLNVNSVDQSPTMFSRRVFELLACATPVISTPARGIEEMLGDTVLTTDTPERTADLVDWVVNEPDARERHAHLGYRLVHREHTYADRVDEILQQVGRPADRARRRVSVICVSNRPAQLDHVIDSYLRQTYDDRELVFVANDDGFDDAMLASVEARVPGSRVLQIASSATLGDCLNEALRVADGDYFAKFDDDDHYGDEYLADVMMTFPYSGAAVSGKQCYFAYLEGQDRTVLRFPGREFRDAPRVVGGTIVADRSMVGDIEFQAVPRGTDTLFLDEVKARGMTVFSADRFNFCQVRHTDVTAHTWKIDDETFLKGCADVAAGFHREAIFL